MMAKCPKDGTEVAEPKKSWELKGGRSKKVIKIGLFECPKCKSKFRATVK